jgi:hypothetical protein
MTNHPPFQRPDRFVPWDSEMIAQLPSGQSRAWFVTLDQHGEVSTGRVLNIDTRREYVWFVAANGKITVEAEVPKHVVKTVRSLLVRPKRDELTEAAKREISCMTTLIYDLAATLDQKVDIVKDTKWFIRRVEDRLIGECKQFSHLAPNYKEK